MERPSLHSNTDLKVFYEFTQSDWETRVQIGKNLRPTPTRLGVT
jgi:hypothetical protein